MAKRTKYVKPEDRRICTAEVVASKRVSPHFVRVTVGGPDLADFTPMGYDQWFRLFLRRPQQSELRLPTAANNLWYAQYLMMSKDTRPLVRNYTVRDFRPAGGGQFGEHAEIDIDFVSHGDDSPASAWANNVSTGTTVGLFDEGVMYQAPEHTNWTLLVGDESALPALAGILRSAPRDLRGAAYLEIPHADDVQELGEPEGVQVHWLPRTGESAKIGELAAATVRTAELPDTGVYGFIAGEQALASGVRRHLVNERGIPKADVTFTGYWRFGKAAPS
ncbi:siderophore-interacting protein [Nocardia cyriacigeorgica]|uniref:Siderophore-interacting protein n=1 Tax=Nocardia cyriacigeorgica TaxID=135487 RepID=A0A6P1CGL5_9NOCA|nr:siderophore-interacting protein [Nocardia cyriacigeorgica]MBF6285259.1 siderophore-interacting protein [Nocardia cyriacigeorgica]NEW31710.1 siderophore-interacting protein [Nocardia cyriacigeorgica]BDT89383.1 siderophore-interacting protein [Nocardia cyriacigeorgica]